MDYIEIRIFYLKDLWIDYVKFMFIVDLFYFNVVVYVLKVLLL